jgi:Bacterial Ig-like domain (group 3)
MSAVLFRRRFRPQLERLEDRSVPTATTTALTASLNPAALGQPITFTATVTGGDFPAGTIPQFYTRDSGTNDVTFFDGATPLATLTPTPTGGPNNESRARFITSGLGSGTHAITARYNGVRVYVDFLGGKYYTSEDLSTSNAVNEVITAVNEVITAPPPAPPPAIAGDVSGAVSVARVPLPGARNAAVRLVRLRNTGGATVEGPLYLVLHGLKRKVRLKGASGLAQQHGQPGDPFVTLNVSLRPGEELTLILRFSNPTHRSIRFTAQVLAGPGPV